MMFELRTRKMSNDTIRTVKCASELRAKFELYDFLERLRNRKSGENRKRRMVFKCPKIDFFSANIEPLVVHNDPHIGTPNSLWTTYIIWQRESHQLGTYVLLWIRFVSEIHSQNIKFGQVPIVFHMYLHHIRHPNRVRTCSCMHCVSLKLYISLRLIAARMLFLFSFFLILFSPLVLSFGRNPSLPPRLFLSRTDTHTHKHTLSAQSESEIRSKMWSFARFFILAAHKILSDWNVWLECKNKNKINSFHLKRVLDYCVCL